ncbi:phosphatase PAP2 family protein [Hoyosella sp. G463]|uniref:Phosphatase PAP2 family protein n=1 Tax=Lolliginicoccus lacisalsi TaxID=2742202 RepID=A0A927PKK3_9ACTN|nr:phosphatase PAP2 family protein [Lolliginicoccus lacisalsi]MBD8505818.1 phosphatase PAP2 family protein [Lolliginicoccus lacisalsi]
MVIELDVAVLEWFLRAREPAWDTIFTVITLLGSSIGVFLMGGAAMAWSIARRQPHDALIILCVLVSGWVLMWILKFIMRRDRPGAELALVEATSSSFPSGHAMMSSMFAIALAATVVRARWAWPVVAALPVLVGISRVYLGVHWPTDVLAGWFIGVLWALACLMLHAALRPTRPAHRQLQRN